MIIQSKLNFKLTRIAESKIGLVTLRSWIPHQHILESRTRSYLVDRAMFIIAQETLLFIQNNHPTVWNQLLKDSLKD